MHTSSRETFHTLNLSVRQRYERMNSHSIQSINQSVNPRSTTASRSIHPSDRSIHPSSIHSGDLFHPGYRTTDARRPSSSSRPSSRNPTKSRVPTRSIHPHASRRHQILIINRAYLYVVVVVDRFNADARPVRRVTARAEITVCDIVVALARAR